MAFLRVEKKSSGSYLRIVETYRESGKVRHRVIASLGKKEDYTPEQLKRMGEKLYELGGGDLKQLVGEQAEEVGRFNYGYSQVVIKALSHYGLDSLLANITRRKKLSYSVLDCVLLMIVERLHDPGSKRSNYYHQSEFLGLEPVKLHHLYRSLDRLADHAQQVQQHIYNRRLNLFNQQLDVVFYDVTTFYFDSNKEDGLRLKGFSKDGKQGKVQILFGLLIDKNKEPIGYQIYKGDFYEGHTFEDAILRLKQTYQINRIIVVADRGMLNEANIQVTEQDNGYGFIMGERLKSLPKQLKNYLINMENYTAEWEYDKNGEPVKIKYAIAKYKGRTIIGTYSKKRAEKDKHDREEKLEKSMKLLEDPSKISRKAARFFLKNEKDEKYVLNEDKIKEHARYDGFLAIATNEPELSPAIVLDHYRHLFQIEHTFRTFKSHLETRPMFHWTEKRIEGHICLCYITYTILNHLLLKLKKQNVKISERQLRHNLDRMQVSLLAQGQNAFFLRSANNEQIPAIINKLGLSAIPSLIPKDQINSYL